MEDLVAAMDARDIPQKRGAYKKRGAEISKDARRFRQILARNARKRFLLQRYGAYAFQFNELIAPIDR